ncbi:MAG TPA: 2-amino-4-hydroxy-6-hydroxymethyldihydropteridine diphosphokinase [bacterium]
MGLGSNLGNRENAIQGAIQALEQWEGIGDLRCSSIYETEPWGVPFQRAFLNCAVECQTDLRPNALLEACKRIEASLGRIKGPRWGPRSVDVDILLYGDEVVRTEGLIVPHPKIAERRFVLIPLDELAGNAVVPGTGKTVRMLLDACPDKGSVRLVEKGKGVLE